MVNGMFRLRSDWEKVAGQTWSTRPFCRPVRLLKNTQDPEKPEFSNLAQLSLRTWRSARLGRASRGSAKDRQSSLGERRRGSDKGENHRWRTRFSSDFRDRPRSSAISG